MAIERYSLPRTSDQDAPRQMTVSELLDRLMAFEGPPEAFLYNLLALQCHLAGASGAALFRTGEGGKIEPLSVYPARKDNTPAPVWLAQAAEWALDVISSGQTQARALPESDELYGQPANRQLVMLPLKQTGGTSGLAAFLIESRDADTLQRAAERLELTTSLLSLYSMRLTLQRKRADLKRLRNSMEILSATNEPRRFQAAAMLFCNEIASVWSFERVSIGILKGRYVQIKALSHTEKFSRKMQVVQDIESAMEECLDQDTEVMYPEPRGSAFVSRSHKHLATQHGPSTALSMPLRLEGKPVAVVTVERSHDQPLTVQEVETLRLTCDLCAPPLLRLHDQDRWAGAKLSRSMRSGLGVVLGARYTWAKIAVLAVIAAAIALTVVQGPYQAEGSFVLQATRRQVVPAPYAGRLESVEVELDDPVEAGQVLARLDAEELRLELLSAQAELQKVLREAQIARGEPGKTAEARIAEAQADQVRSRIDLLEYRLSKADLTSPIDGRVIQGDWQRNIGKTVEAGEVLFEVAPLETLRAELFIPEDQIADVTVGQTGQLATAADPDRRIDFVVERINPVAEVRDEQNVFRVRVRLEGPADRDRLRPGLEGVARIDLGERSLGWLWTRRVVNWVRMKLWL